MKNIIMFLFPLLLLGCLSKEKEGYMSAIEKEKVTENKPIDRLDEKNLKMTAEEEVLSVAINYVVDLRKEFVGNGETDLLFIDEMFDASMSFLYEKNEKYSGIIPTDLLKNYLAVFSEQKQNPKQDGSTNERIDSFVRNLDLKYNYEIENPKIGKGRGVCVFNWYKEKGIDPSEIGKTDKERHTLLKKCYIGKPQITIVNRVGFNNKKDLSLVELKFTDPTGIHFNPPKPYLSGTSVIVLKKIRGKWSVVLHDDLYFGEKVLGPATQQ